ncbi:phosphoglycerate kinase [Candidatus Micrarchaeota archaeon]|nr:phosphoglycerate kinase [Candidatus Micrarchaeota archaeon]MBU2477032.1 phosphoglycerate kinase [Candidatus Micrarchaeota archaeon]
MLKSINSVQVKGKTILVRIDINSNIQEGKPVVSGRLKEHAKTISFFSSKKAKTVVLSHQGRKGESDFVSLKGHLIELEKLAGKKIFFSSWEENFKEKISSLKEGEILLMENTRFLEFESIEKTPLEHSKEKIISELASVADYFVLDALSVSHRSHASVVGFIPLLPSFMGPVLESEIKNLDKALNSKEKPRLLVLGGAKPEDSLKTLNFFLKENKTDKALISGVFGELFLVALGYKFGKKDSFFESKGFLSFIPEIKEVYKEFNSKLVFPKDFAFDVNGKKENLFVFNLPSDFISKDIGENTIKEFSEEIKKAKLVVFNGPPGVFEEKEFSVGTKAVFQAMKESNAFTFLGGGDTGTALNFLGFSPKDFSFVSLSGKASLKYLSGKKLVGIEALRNSKN